MDANTFLWIAFFLIIGTAMYVDLGRNQDAEHAHSMSLREAGLWTSIWISLGLSFGLLIAWFRGFPTAMEYWAGYLLEESLSVDNMFVFLLIFSFFKIPSQYQPRVLKWGILGAIGMRAAIIFAGLALIQRFHWIMYVFGVLLLVTALKMLFQKEDETESLENQWIVKTAKRFIPVTHEIKSQYFFVKENGKKVATPLFLALLVVEVSDLVFAVDSIPAVLAVSKDPFVVFSSNIFAVMGLRALYFLIAGFMGMFRYLKLGLVVILLFISFKMLAMGFIHVPIGLSLAVIASVLLISILSSLWVSRQERFSS